MSVTVPSNPTGWPRSSRLSRAFSVIVMTLPSRRLRSYSASTSLPSRLISCSISCRRLPGRRTGRSVEPIARSSSQRGVAEHGDQRRVGGQQVAVHRHLVDAFDDVVEQAAEPPLALAQRVLGDGAARWRCVASWAMRPTSSRSRRDGMPVRFRYVAKVPSMRPSAPGDRRGPAGRAGPRASRRLAAVFPERVLGDVRHDDLALQRDRRGAGAEADLGRVVVHQRDVLARQALADDVVQHALDRVVHADAADRVRQHALDHLGDRAQRAASSGSLEAIFSSARRSPAATSSACLRSVMSMMLARIRLPLRARQPHEADFAGDHLARRRPCAAIRRPACRPSAPPRRSRA